MKKDKRQILIDWINETFKVKNQNYPLAFVRGERFIISAEVDATYPEKFMGESITMPVADYYGEHTDGFAWVEKRIELKAKELGLLLEWYDSGTIHIYNS
jgi:hypothetical protein